ncbi:MAG: hypothetical protein EXR99_02185 [Gemmataceae bacterium]|nr:hypothetical protein [Gemmataceae bacterium]
MGIEITWESWQVLAAFGLYLFGVGYLAWFSHSYLKKDNFISDYFLGNRGLGPWVLALSVAATAISGGTFMGFPSLIYSNGWIMALWIAGYMVVPMTGMIFLGRRINHFARISGSVTVPDIFRDRFNSPILGICASLFILFFLIFNLVAQFKAGGLLMKEALRIMPAQAGVEAMRDIDKGAIEIEFKYGDNRRETLSVQKPQVGSTLSLESSSVDEKLKKVELVFLLEGKRYTKTVNFPLSKIQIPFLQIPIDLGYFLGLIIFSLTVISYTTFGGFWAVTWTDVLEGIVMLVGVVILAFLAWNAVPALGEKTGLAAATEHLKNMSSPGSEPGALVYGPGPGHFLTIGLAFSFFCLWPLASAGQPSAMVRLMSFKDTPSLRRALVLVSSYYLLTYFSLLVIFICARSIFPTQYLREIGSEGVPDSIMPALIRHLAHPMIAGVLLAAPYAAIMSTVAAFLLIISSSLVRDLFQRTLYPQASEKTLKWMSYSVTFSVGLIVMLGALRPPDFLQYIIVFTGSGQGAAFLFPMTAVLYWKRATRMGVLAGMAGGFLSLVSLYLLGWMDNWTQVQLGMSQGGSSLASTLQTCLGWIPGWGEMRHDSFAPLFLCGLDPVVWGLLASLALTWGGSLLTRHDETQAEKFFPSR